MTPESYYFGNRIAVRCDYYAFPRTGSHYLWACLTGLLDLVFFPNDFVNNPETCQRAEELNPQIFYGLRLRQDGIPFQPVYLDSTPQGVHGIPTASHWPVLILIRDPHPTIYSWYHTATERWGVKINDRRVWIQDTYAQYRKFYDAALMLVNKNDPRTHLIRFEDLKNSPNALQQIISFIGVEPKLSPEFVHYLTEFERMTKPGFRTFYRTGNNSCWRDDLDWYQDLLAIQTGDFSDYGYQEVL